MATYIESGLCVNLPDGQHFRFADLPVYRSANGHHLKEMDFAWIDTGQLILLEIRSYAQVTTTVTSTDFVPSKGQPVPYRFQALIDKVTDSLLMLLAAWADSVWGQQLKQSLPAAARTRLPLKLVVAVDLPASLVIHLQGLRDSLNAQLQGRIGLADVSRVALLDYARLVSDPRFSNLVKLHP